MVLTDVARDIERTIVSAFRATTLQVLSRGIKENNRYEETDYSYRATDSRESVGCGAHAR